MTSVPPTQPPAAPETDTSAGVLSAAEQKALGIRDADCGCCFIVDSTGLREFITAARERVRVVEGERKEWKSRAFDAVARAESAEAAHRALREDIEALADEAKARKAAYPDHPHWAAWDHYESDLRALLAGGAR